MWDYVRMDMSHLPSRRDLHAPPDSPNLPVSVGGRSPHLPRNGGVTKWISALTVAILSLVIAIPIGVASLVWPAVLATSLGAVTIAIGWGKIVDVPLALPSQIIVAASGILSACAVALVGDQSVVFFVAGLALVLLMGAEVWMAPTPRNHAAAGTDESLSEEEEVAFRRAMWIHSSTTASLTASVSSLLVAIGGATWVALASQEGWRLLLPIAAFLVAVVVVGDQVGDTWGRQSLGAFISGIIGGLLGATILLTRGQGVPMGDLILPLTSRLIGESGSVLLLGVLAGTLVALIVIVVDALMGEHSAERGARAAMARGAVKFLISGIVIYTIIRVGGA